LRGFFPPLCRRRRHKQKIAAVAEKPQQLEAREKKEKRWLAAVEQEHNSWNYLGLRQFYYVNTSYEEKTASMQHCSSICTNVYKSKPTLTLQHARQ
jgi:hypothetical protein